MDCDDVTHSSMPMSIANSMWRRIGYRRASADVPALCSAARSPPRAPGGSTHPRDLLCVATRSGSTPAAHPAPGSAGPCPEATRIALAAGGLLVVVLGRCPVAPWGTRHAPMGSYERPSQRMYAPCKSII